MHFYLIRVIGYHYYNNKFYRVYKFGKSNKDFEIERYKGYSGCNKCEKILYKFEINEDLEKYFLDSYKNNTDIKFIKKLGNEYFIIIYPEFEQINDVMELDDYVKNYLIFFLHRIETLKTNITLIH